VRYPWPVVETRRDPSEHVFELTGCFGVRLDEAHRVDLQEFYDHCREYFELVTGEPPGPNEGEELLRSVPRGKTLEDKFVIGFFDAPGHMVGVLDVIRNYPRDGEWYVSQLLFGPSSRGRHLGERVHKRLEEWVHAEGGTALQLIVQEQNPGALRFWQRMGFEVRGMGKQILKDREQPFIRMTRELAPVPEPTGTFIQGWLAAWRRARTPRSP
jgi:ribosomal protein S18 acetylase RimI-like enzyme